MKAEDRMPKTEARRTNPSKAQLSKHLIEELLWPVIFFDFFFKKRKVKSNPRIDMIWMIRNAGLYIILDVNLSRFVFLLFSIQGLISGMRARRWMIKDEMVKGWREASDNHHPIILLNHQGLPRWQVQQRPMAQSKKKTNSRWIRMPFDNVTVVGKAS